MSPTINKVKALEEMYQDEDLDRIRTMLLALIDSTFWLHKRFDFPKEVDSKSGGFRLFTELGSNHLLAMYQAKETILSEISELGNEFLSLKDENKIFEEMIDIIVVAIRQGYLYGGSKFINAIVNVVKKNDAKTLETHVLVNGKIQRRIKESS